MLLHSTNTECPLGARLWAGCWERQEESDPARPSEGYTSVADIHQESQQARNVICVRAVVTTKQGGEVTGRERQGFLKAVLTGGGHQEALV